MPPRTYTKTFLPLESNPEIFTSLAHNLGLSSSLRFIEVYDLDEEPAEEVLAYVLAFPTSEGYDDEVEARDAANNGQDFKGKERDTKDTVASNSNDETKVLWLRQTIHNACGLYALLHATCNGHARNHISTSFSFLPSCSIALTKQSGQGSILHTLLTTSPSEQSTFLSSSPELEKLYTVAANTGDTVTPEQGEEVEWHYTCFVPDLNTQRLLELDGDRWGPLEHAVLDDEQGTFGVKAREVIKKEYFGVARGTGKEGMFSVLALVHAE
jgi:ubiquitin carboxyl-terminal hydrolase L3